MEQNMNPTLKIETGMSIEEYFVVGEEHLAQHIGSGSVRVLATPWMIALMERVSHKLLSQTWLMAFPVWESRLKYSISPLPHWVLP
jgi:hypothetical protein